MNRLLTVIFATLSMLILHVPVTAADGIIIPEPPICDPCPVPPPPERETPYLTVQSHVVNITIADQIATTRVDQIFRNDSAWSLEGTYIFPLPEQAAISDFAMWIDGERVESQLYTKEEARRIYDSIVRRRLDPALLEYIGRDLFQASIFPIEPGDTRRVQIEYTQALPMDNGLLNYVYPLSTEQFSAKPLERVAITVDIQSPEPLKTVYAASHPVNVQRDGPNRALVGWEATNVLPDTDFSLFYTVSPHEVGVNLLSHRPPEATAGFFTLFVAPSVNPTPKEIIAKDVLLVLDTSGSMEGEKIAQARDALKFVLDNLNPEDRFNIIAFSTGVNSFARQPVPLSQRAAAHQFVDGLMPGGSTDINRALLEALSSTEMERPTILIFLTDGLPTSGVIETPLIINNIEQAANSNLRLFPFGVGNDVDTMLLDTLAQELRGASAYVRPGERIDEQVSSFYAKVSTPILADLELTFSPNITISETYPYPLPDLFAGTQLILTGRYEGGGASVITLTGQVNNQPRTFVYDDLRFERPIASAFHAGPKAEFIPRLWATRKIGHLLNQIRLHGENREAIDEIVNLSVRYGIVTPYTSFLVEEPELALRETGRTQLVDDEFAEAAAAPMAPAFGGAAVERSVQQSAMAEADMAAPPGMGFATAEGDDVQANTPAMPVVKTVGDKAFVLQNGIWTDTTFDAEQMTPTPLTFGSEPFFDFLTATPQAGRYFALGEQVIVVLNGTAYQTTPTP